MEKVMCTKFNRFMLALVGLLAMAVPKTVADTCPDGAVSTGLGWILTAYRSNSVTHVLVPIGSGQVGACETIFLQATASYVARDINNNIVAAFSDGGMAVSRDNNTFFANITPAGAVPSFTATGSGPAVGQPYTFVWSGPNGFTQTDANVTSSTINISSAQAANAGTYTATITDAFGCTSTCTATLVVNPNPTCAITGDSPVCSGTTHTYTSTVSPAGGTVQN